MKRRSAMTENHLSCTLCHEPTWMIGTDRCSRCYELEYRINADPTLARLILNKIGKEEKIPPCATAKEYRLNYRYKLPANYKIELWYSDGLYHWIYRNGKLYGAPYKDPVEAYHAARKHAASGLK